MTTIDLHNEYPWYPTGSFVSVPDDVAAVMKEFVRAEVARQVQAFRYRAYYSLDGRDNIEASALEKPEQPADVVERELVATWLQMAIASLPDKQAQYIDAYFFEGKNLSEIARAHGVSKQRVAVVIKRALTKLKDFLEPL